MNLSDIQRYRIVLTILLVVITSGLTSAWIAHERWSVDYVPYFFIANAFVLLPLLLFSLFVKTNMERVRSSAILFIGFLAITSWAGLVLNSHNWHLISFIHFGAGWSYLLAIDQVHKRRNIIVLNTSVALQILYFGLIHRTPVEVQDWATATAINEFLTSYTWGATFILYLSLGFFIYLSVNRRDQQLYKLNKQSEMKDQFTRIYNHNIKTPLQTIALQAEILKVKHGETQHNHVIQQNVDFIQGRIGQILTVHEPNSNSTKQTVKELVEMLDLQYPGAVLMKDNNVKLDLSVSKVIYLACENFIENAIRYGDDHPEIHVKTLGEHLFITIKDNGAGMNHKELKEYGVPTISSKGGSGVGVYLSTSLLQKAGYQVRVNSKTNHGTTVEIAPEGTWAPLLDVHEGVKVI